jgi:hypothetical protein
MKSVSLAMRRMKHSTAALATALAVLPLVSGCTHANHNHPPNVLWAWERREDLRSADPDHFGVAELAATITLNSSGVSVHRRMQPLQLASGATVISVVRIETTPGAALDDGELQSVENTIATLAQNPAVRGLQIDFDTTSAQREFYGTLLRDLRRRLGKQAWISITALASWCMYDDWIRELPVNEAVPMLFALGAGRTETEAYLASGEDFRDPLCRSSVGVLLGDDHALVPPGRRVYWFNNGGWNSASVAQMMIEQRRLE